MSKVLFLLCLSFGAAVANATIFTPISIKKQIKESDGVVQGEVVNIEVVEEEGKIQSKVTLLANKWIGVTPEENFVDLYFPGGTLGDRALKIHGAPNFELGENVVLFTRKFKGKDWVNNLGLGKYSAKRIGERTLIVNQIFPAHPTVGQMNIDKFYDLVEWVKKEKFNQRFKDKYEINTENQRRIKNKFKSSGRSIASVNEYGESEESSNQSVYWLLILFGGLGALYGAFRNRA